MRKEQRQQEILDFLRAAGVLSPKELAEQLYMSLSTVYRDIHDLEGQKLLIRTAEGQVAIPGEQRYTPAPYKRNLYREEKIAIARSESYGIYAAIGFVCKAAVCRRIAWSGLSGLVGRAGR